jgi:hypothetical protein
LHFPESQLCVSCYHNTFILFSLLWLGKQTFAC